MKVAIVGAGVSGLATARALRSVGHRVDVYEAASDVGGVWSASRRYPGISIQNDKRSYAFSDLPMPDDYPEFPGGELVQDYLHTFVDANELGDVLHLDSRVTLAEPLRDGGWTISVDGPLGSTRDEVDWLVVANGMFSSPSVPSWPGRDAFEAAGGRVLSPSEVGTGASLADGDTVVVGWGKSACDIAAATVGHSCSVTLVARGIGWKLPKRIGSLSYQRMMLSRLGEHLLWAPYRSTAARLLRFADRPVRAAAVRRLAWTLARQLDLDRLGLRPRAAANELDSLVSEGFFEAVDAGEITVVRDTTITRLGSERGRPIAELSDGTTIAADAVVAATGYDQDIPFLSPEARERLLDEHGDVRLYRRLLPLDVPRLAIVGWVGSYRSPINAEVQALWLASMLDGRIRLPDRSERERAAQIFRRTHERATAAGLPQLPSNCSILDLDTWLADADLQVSPRVHLRELLRPLDPADYRHLLDRLRRRLHAKQAGSPADERLDALRH